MDPILYITIILSVETNRVVEFDRFFGAAHTFQGPGIEVLKRQLVVCRLRWPVERDTQGSQCFFVSANHFKTQSFLPERPDTPHLVVSQTVKKCNGP